MCDTGKIRDAWKFIQITYWPALTQLYSNQPVHLDVVNVIDALTQLGSPLRSEIRCGSEAW